MWPQISRPQPSSANPAEQLGVDTFIQQLVYGGALALAVALLLVSCRRAWRDGLVGAAQVHAERELDELAAETCDALAHDADSRCAGRATHRYERTRDRVRRPHPVVSSRAS